MTTPTETHEWYLPENEGIQCLRTRKSPIPELKSTEVLVKVGAVSLNFRDLLISKGSYPFELKPEVVVGSDMSGTIISIGSEVKEWNVGDKVCANFTTDHLYGDITADMKETTLGGPIDGVLTKYKILPQHSLVLTPQGWSLEEASTLPCAAVTAYNALMGPTPIKAGDYVVIQGTGGVSIFGLQFALASGAIVIATSSSDEKLKVAQKLGAHHTINYKKTPDWDAEVMRITKNRGADHIVEVGGPGTLEKSFNCVRYAGWIHTIGFLASGDASKDIAFRCLSKGVMLRGILIGSVEQFKNMNRLIEAGNVKPVIDKVFAFDQVREAYDHLESQKHIGKIVVRVDEE